MGERTLSDTALKLILAKAYEQPVPELHGVEMDMHTGEVRDMNMVINLN